MLALKLPTAVTALSSHSAALATLLVVGSVVAIAPSAAGTAGGLGPGTCAHAPASGAHPLPIVAGGRHGPAPPRGPCCPRPPPPGSNRSSGPGNASGYLPPAGTPGCCPPPALASNGSAPPPPSAGVPLPPPCCAGPNATGNASNATGPCAGGSPPPPCGNDTGAPTVALRD
jgi:hypothetical protein